VEFEFSQINYFLIKFNMQINFKALIILKISQDRSKKFDQIYQALKFCLYLLGLQVSSLQPNIPLKFPHKKFSQLYMDTFHIETHLRI